MVPVALVSVREFRITAILKDLVKRKDDGTGLGGGDGLGAPIGKDRIKSCLGSNRNDEVCLA